MKIQIFAMHSNFRYDSEKQCIAKFRRDCEIFAMVAKFFSILAKFSLYYSENPALPALPPASVSSVPLDISSSRLDEITENSYEFVINQHQYEAKLEMMAEVPKTYKITKNNLETKSVVLNGPVHVNWLNSYD